MKSKYKNIPVDHDTYSMVVVLCEAFDMNKRSQGALVRKWARYEYEKLEKAKILPKWEIKKLEMEIKQVIPKE